MSRSVNKFLLIMLVTLIAMAPLQGIRAAIEMMSVPDMNQQHIPATEAMSLHQQAADMGSEHCLEKCENCNQRSCNDQHLCHKGQCFSSSVYILASFQFNVEYIKPAQAFRYMGHVLAASPSQLFRPPRA